jgi:hypothetical protein
MNKKINKLKKKKLCKVLNYAGGVVIVLSTSKPFKNSFYGQSEEKPMIFFVGPRTPCCGKELTSGFLYNKSN